MNDIAAEYIGAIQSGRQVACKLVKAAVDRHLRDLARVGDPEFPYYYDEAFAEEAILFTEQLHHTKGEWADDTKHETRLRLEPWQKFIYCMIYGWRRLDGRRRFSKAYVTVGRKNGKTTKGAAMMNYGFFVDNPREMGPECYCVATKRDQAKIAWAEAERQIQKAPVLKAKSKTYKQTATVMIPGTAARMRPLGKDSDTEDGLNPHFVLVDEYHAHPDNGMLEVMYSGMGARQQPLMLIITTAGFEKYCPCYQEEHVLAVQILERTIDPVPENYFCIIYTLDEGDDFTDPAVWIKANPNLGVSVSRDFLAVRVQEALQSPAKMNKILTKNFNIWTQAETRWLAPEAWDGCDFPVDPEKLRERRCWMGMDLSASQDITALVLCFPPEEKGGRYEFLYRFFIPGDDIVEKERKDHVPYAHWIREGYIIATPGNVIDYDFIEQTIQDDAKGYQIQEIAYDPWKAQEIVNHLVDHFVMVETYQRYSGMAQGTDTFEKKVLARELAHGGNPVMRWMIACTEVKSDRQGNLMPMKPERGKTGKRIDGVVASIMALHRAVVNNETGSVYSEERGIIAL